MLIERLKPGLGPALMGVAGAALLAIPAHRFRIDRIVCTAFPSLHASAGYFAIYLVGLALLAAGWLAMTRAATRGGLTVRRVLLLGAIVHGVALLSPPFLSHDPLYYSTIGREQATYHHGAFTRLRDVMPAADPFLSRLPPALQAEPSNYMPGFHAVAWAIAKIGGDDLTLNVRLYQLVGLAAMLAAAWLAGRTTGARGAALVLFCPLSVIEGTIGGHNDALLAVSVALFALAVVRRRRTLALAALAAGLLVKASALLLLAMWILHLGLEHLDRRLRPVRGPILAAAAGVALAVGCVLTALVWPLLQRYTLMLTKLVGPPAGELVFCTRSVECLPRAALHFVAHLPSAAWLLGLGFRGGAIALLIWSAVKSLAGGRLLAWTGTFLFFYFLFFHAYSQSWYLLSLLPLVCHAEPRLLRPMLVFCISALAYYAIDIPFDCDLRPWTVGTTEVLQGLVVIVPPTMALLRDQGASEPARGG